VADWLVVMHEKGDLRIITAPAIDMRSGQLGAFIFAANGPASAGLYAWAKVGEMLVADGVDLQRYANDLRTGIEDARKTAKKRGGAEPSSS
ncbi:MAG TPA: hypothetical protein VD838_07560, partial [Anaeromyxobacteraceae bacterium]|nr:hypothetical protein [Anaeromyxobacteraceae bacterium]